MARTEAAGSTVPQEEWGILNPVHLTAQMGGTGDRRAVAQLGSALHWGCRGRGFKSRQPDRVMSQDIGIARTYRNVGSG